MIVYVVEFRSGPGQPKTVRVERHTTREATGLWNRLRRRRLVTDVEVLGIFRANVHNFELQHSTNRPSTLSLSLSGSDPLFDLTTKEV